MASIIVILIGIIIFLLVNNNIEKEETKKSDAEKFAEEYTLVDKDNRFVYTEIDEIININFDNITFKEAYEILLSTSNLLKEIYK